MKYFITVLFIMFMVSGCSITDKTIKSVQPSNNKAYEPAKNVVELEADEICFKSPKQAIRNKDGNPILDKDGKPFMESVLDKNGKPIMARVFFKDQTVKAPTTVLDCVQKGLGIWAIWDVSKAGLSTIKAMAGLAAKDPVQIPTPAPRTDYVTGTDITVDRG